jgi:large subunit ribosomal protein L9
MRLILKQDVQDLGREGDLVTVAEGYGRNYLLPRRMAVLATPGNMKDHDKRIRAAQEREAKDRGEAMALLERLRQLRVTLTHRAAEGSTRLHGSITANEIADKLNTMLPAARTIDRREIDVRQPIRTLGEHTVNVRLGKGMAAPLTVEVLDENAPRGEQAAPAAAAPAAAAPARPEPAEDPTEPEEIEEDSA